MKAVLHSTDGDEQIKPKEQLWMIQRNGEVSWPGWLGKLEKTFEKAQRLKISPQHLVQLYWFILHQINYVYVLNSGKKLCNPGIVPPPPDEKGFLADYQPVKMVPLCSFLLDRQKCGLFDNFVFIESS